MANTTITLPSGRSAGLFAAGDPMADRLVVLFHPTAGSAEFDPDPTITARWGVHLVALDRPGYGSSAPLAASAPHRMVDRADDVGAYLQRTEQMADRISSADLHQLGVIGWGTGGLLAAALAARFPDRVDRLALVSVPAPEKAITIAQQPATAAADHRLLHIDDDDSDLGRHLGLLRRIDRMVEAAFLQGNAGVAGDQELLADHSWLDGLSQVRADTRLWVGRRDPVIDDADAEWWGNRIPGAHAVHVKDSGPLTIAASWKSVLAHVAPQHGQEQADDRDRAAVRLPDVDPVHPDAGRNP